MSPSRILAIARRIAQGFRRDERTLGLMFVVPLVVTALLGWVLSEQVDEVVDVAIVNEAGDVGDRIVDAMEDAAAAPDSDIDGRRRRSARRRTPEAEACVRDGSARPRDRRSRRPARRRPRRRAARRSRSSPRAPTPPPRCGRFGDAPERSWRTSPASSCPPGANPPVLPQVERRDDLPLAGRLPGGRPGADLPRLLRLLLRLPADRRQLPARAHRRDARAAPGHARDPVRDRDSATASGSGSSPRSR